MLDRAKREWYSVRIASPSTCLLYASRKLIVMLKMAYGNVQKQNSVPSKMNIVIILLFSMILLIMASLLSLLKTFSCSFRMQRTYSIVIIKIGITHPMTVSVVAWIAICCRGVLDAQKYSPLNFTWYLRNIWGIDVPMAKAHVRTMPHTSLIIFDAREAFADTMTLQQKGEHKWISNVFVS